MSKYLRANPWGIDKNKVMAHFIGKPDIWKSRALKDSEDEAASFYNRYLLERTRKKDKQGKPIEYLIDAFSRQVLDRAKKYTPKQSDDKHNEEHPSEPHLRDAYKIKNAHNFFSDYGFAVYIVNENSYAAAVHEDIEAQHDYPTRAEYLESAATEVSAEYNDPFDIYIKIGPRNVELYITYDDPSVSVVYKNKYNISMTLYTEKYIESYTKRELNRKEIYDYNLLNRHYKGTLNNVNIIRKQETLTKDGFVLLVKGRGLNEDYNFHLQDEIEAREMIHTEYNEDFDNFDF